MLKEENWTRKTEAGDWEAFWAVVAVKGRIACPGDQILDENRSRDKGGVCKLRRPSPVSCGRWRGAQTAWG